VTGASAVYCSGVMIVQFPIVGSPPGQRLDSRGVYVQSEARRNV
jgi:hypothetical protein